MSNWLDEFLGSRIVKRVVLANYMDHLKLKTEGRNSYANIEEALEDFASRTGLTDMQKRALRRQVFVKFAIDMPKVNFEDDLKLVENGQAPAAILPGVQPGSELSKKLKHKQPIVKQDDTQPQQANRDVEDNAQQKAPGSSDTGAVVDIKSNVNRGIIIEAAEWEELETKEKKPVLKFVGPERKKKGPGGKTSKEKKLLLQIQALQNQLVELYMQPGGSISNPNYRTDLTKEERHAKLDIEGEINEIRNELADLRWKEKHKQELASPKHQALGNDVIFIGQICKGLGLSTINTHERKEELKRLSPEGLQHLFDTAIGEFRSKLYYKPSQGHDEKFGDYVKCMVCDSQGKLWVNTENPSILPFSHLEEHADILLAAAGIDLTKSDRAKYREEIINAYLRMYPGSALQSREQEMASLVEKMATQASDEPMLHPAHVATDTEKDLSYSDVALKDMILFQFRRFGVEPPDKDVDELANETLVQIKERLDEEFPDAIGERTEGKLPEIGKLVKIPFGAFHRAFREEVGQVVNDYRGTFSDFKPITKRPKRRWTSTEREQARQEAFKQLRKEDAAEELAEELGHWPNEEELREWLRRKDMVPVKISVTGGRTCWNCGQAGMVYVDNNKLAINSATCPYCGVYREVLVKNHEGGNWKCPQCGEEHWYVIRDPNEGDEGGGSKVYVVHCDETKIGDGVKAVGASRFVKSLQRAEREIYTTIQAPEGEAKERWTVPVQLGEEVRLVANPNKYGRVVYVEGSIAWVDWNDDKKVKIKDSKDQVLYVKSADPNLAGYNKVTDVIINPDGSVIVKTINTSNTPQVLPFPNSKILNADAPTATRMESQEIQKIEIASRRHNRVCLAMKIASTGCSGFEAVTIDRYVQKEEREIKFKRSDLLRRFIRRARLSRQLGVK